MRYNIKEIFEELLVFIEYGINYRYKDTISMLNELELKELKDISDTNIGKLSEHVVSTRGTKISLEIDRLIKSCEKISNDCESNLRKFKWRGLL